MNSVSRIEPEYHRSVVPLNAIARFHACRSAHSNSAIVAFSKPYFSIGLSRLGEEKIEFLVLSRSWLVRGQRWTEERSGSRGRRGGRSEGATPPSTWTPLIAGRMRPSLPSQRPPADAVSGSSRRLLDLGERESPAPASFLPLVLLSCSCTARAATVDDSRRLVAFTSCACADVCSTSPPHIATAAAAACALRVLAVERWDERARGHSTVHASLNECCLQSVRTARDWKG